MRASSLSTVKSENAHIWKFRKKYIFTISDCTVNPYRYLIAHRGMFFLRKNIYNQAQHGIL